MNKSQKMPLYIVLSAVLAYLITAFIVLEIDFRLWTEGARSALFLCWIVFAIFITLFVFVMNEGGDK
jgi:hypothetical protein